MKTIEVGAFEAKTHLSRLLDQVAAGMAVTITRHGKPVARMIPPPLKKKRRLSFSKRPGYYMAPDFDVPLADFKEYL